jgi:hypothetical protein
MNTTERLLVEAVSLRLQRTLLGVPKHEPPDDHSLQYLHEHINDLFATRTTDLVHHESVCRAFCKAHVNYDLSDPAFLDALRAEMACQAVPGTEQESALQTAVKVLKEVRPSPSWQERDTGWHPELERVLADAP